MTASYDSKPAWDRFSSAVVASARCLSFRPDARIPAVSLSGVGVSRQEQTKPERDPKNLVDSVHPLLVACLLLVPLTGSASRDPFCREGGKQEATTEGPPRWRSPICRDGAREMMRKGFATGDEQHGRSFGPLFGGFPSPLAGGLKIVGSGRGGEKEVCCWVPCLPG